MREHNAFGPMNRWDRGKFRDVAPMPFEVPKGYKSMRLEVETSLESLWAGKANRKFLRQFAPIKEKKIKEVGFNGELDAKVTGQN